MIKFKEYITEGIQDRGIFKACFMSGSAACFDGETLVKTNTGYKKIKLVNEGEYVLTYNEFNKQQEWHIVEELYKFDNDKEILELIFDNGETVICTEDHKFFVDGEWIKAMDL